MNRGGRRGHGDRGDRGGRRGHGGRGDRGDGGMRARQGKGSAQEGFQLCSLHSDLIWPVCLGYTHTHTHTEAPPFPPCDLQQSSPLSTVPPVAQSVLCFTCFAYKRTARSAQYTHELTRTHTGIHVRLEPSPRERTDKHLATYALFTLVCLSDIGGKQTDRANVRGET